MTQDNFSALSEKFNTLESLINSELLERQRVIQTAILAILSKRHHFQVGDPGIAKSLLVERIATRIDGLGDEGYFRYLLGQYTTPHELFGGLDIPHMRDTGIQKFKTSHKLPKAHLVFLDEIFKANSSVLNTLLTAANEREFYNPGDDAHIPLITIFGASNELPASSELDALWDRLHFRHKVEPIIEETNFVRMLSSAMDDDPDTVLSLDDLYTAQELVSNVHIPEDIYECLASLRETLQSQDIHVSDRRWKECIPIIKAEAFMNGRENADTEDIRPLEHALWSEPDDVNMIRMTVLELANPLERDASELLDKINELSKQLNDALKSKDEVSDISQILIEVNQKLNDTKAQIKTLSKKVIDSGRESIIMEDVISSYKQTAKILLEKGFDKDSDKLKVL